MTSTPLQTIEKPSWYSQTAQRRSLGLAAERSAGMLYVTGWFVVIAVIVVTLMLLGINYWSDVENSAVANGVQVMMWFPFGMSIGLIIEGVSLYLAAGVTRRAIARGFLYSALISSVGLSAVYLAMLYIERLIFSATDWPHLVQLDSDNDITVAATNGGFHNTIGIFMLITVCCLSGHLVAITFMRYKAFIGVITIPFTVIAPIGGAALLLPYTAGRAQFDFIPALRDYATTPLISYLVVLAIAAAVVFATNRILRTIPV